MLGALYLGLTLIAMGWCQGEGCLGAGLLVLPSFWLISLLFPSLENWRFAPMLAAIINSFIYFLIGYQFRKYRDKSVIRALIPAIAFILGFIVLFLIVIFIMSKNLNK